MSYQRRVVKRRPASLTQEEWLQVVERGKLPRPDFMPRDGNPPLLPDVRDLVLEAGLVDLKRRLGVLCVALQKPTPNGTSPGQSSVTVQQGKMLADFSSIWEFLTGTSFADGTSRYPGSLSLKLTSGSLQVTLTDPSTATYCCRSGRKLEDVLADLERAFLDNSLGWRPSGFAKPKK